MFKKDSIYRIFIIFVFTLVSLHIFIIDLKIPNFSSNVVSNPFYEFFLEFSRSIAKFDIISIIFGIFIFDYYYNNYFLYRYKTKYKIIAGVIASIISLLIISYISLNNYHDLRIFYYSAAQIYKCIVVFLGFFLLFYISIIRLFKRG